MSNHRFTTRRTAELRGTPVAELPSRAYAAAKLAMSSSAYSHDDRLDCASEITERFLKDAAEALRLPDCSAVDFIPRELGSFTRMSGLASNFRRSLDRRRAAEDAAAAAAAATEDFRPKIATPDAASVAVELAPVDMKAAHAAAREALAGLGLSRLGKAYPLAYAAVRGITEQDAALELGIGARSATDGARRKAVSVAMKRARNAVPSYAAGMDRDAHMHALPLLDTGGVAMKAKQSQRVASGLVSERERMSQRHMDAACIVRTEQPQPVAGPADWVQDLPANTERRLRRAVELKRERANASNAAKLTAKTAEAGHAYAVR